MEKKKLIKKKKKSEHFGITENGISDHFGLFPLIFFIFFYFFSPLFVW